MNSFRDVKSSMLNVKNFPEYPSTHNTTAITIEVSMNVTNFFKVHSLHNQQHLRIF